MNYYGVMEVSRHHNVLDIRRSYKSLSRKYHPDKNPEPDAELAFNNIKIAYDVRLLFHCGIIAVIFDDFIYFGL